MKIRIATLAMLLVAFQMAGAVSLAPEIVDRLKASGQLESIIQADRQARARGVWEANPDPIRFGAATDVDTLRCLIVLVDFTDMPHEWVYHSDPGDFDTLLFSRGITSPGSMTDYYLETSYGQALLIGQVTPWLRLSQTYAYYVDGQRGFGDYPRNAQRLTEDAVLAADPIVDFSDYDNDGDGWVDALFVVHAGPGYEDTGNLNYIHSHAWVTSYAIPVDGVHVSRYSMEPEETGGGGFATIGVYCHEFGHVLGLPDLYDYGYDSVGAGMWSIMAGGSWGGGGGRPVHFDGWSKIELGWVMPTEPTTNLYDERIDAVEISPDIYRLFSYGVPTTQYFVVENRQRRSFDLSLPGSGLLIYHVDDLAPDNDDQTHYKVAVEQADGRFDLEFNRGSDAGDPWPGSLTRRTFDDFTVPNTRFYNGAPSEVGVYEIGNSDSSMYADLTLMFLDPLYELNNLVFDDAAGNDNGRPESGETCDLVFTAVNIRTLANDLTVTASASDPRITFSDSTSVFGPIPVAEPFSNIADPITFAVPSDYGSDFVDFTLRFAARSGQYIQEFSYRTVIGNPSLLLVDDDSGASIDTFYAQACDSLERTYVIWDVAVDGSPAAALAQYDYVVWFTGNSRAGAVPAADVAGLISYLNGGGRLLVTSQDFVQRLFERSGVQDTILLHQYLKVSYDTFEIEHRVLGAAGGVFDSLEFLTSGNGGAGNQTEQDAVIAYPGGDIILTYRSGRPAGVACRGAYAAMTLGFGLEGANDLFPAYYGTRKQLLGGALQYLQGSVAVDESFEPLPEGLGLAQNYPNPFNPSTRITFNMAGDGQALLEIFDILGRIVAIPLDAELPAGLHQVSWDASAQSTGVYFYRLTTARGAETRKMLLIR